MHDADEMMAQITAERLVEHLERSVYVVSRRIPGDGHARHVRTLWRTIFSGGRWWTNGRELRSSVLPLVLLARGNGNSRSEP